MGIHTPTRKKKGRNSETAGQSLYSLIQLGVLNTDFYPQNLDFNSFSIMPDWQFGNKEFRVTGFNSISSFLHSRQERTEAFQVSPLCLCPQDSGLESPVLTQRPMRSQFENQFGNKCSLWHGRVNSPTTHSRLQRRFQGSSLWPACGVGWKGGGCGEGS